ncbi:hypothetical protein DKZ29_08010 [Limosilactobacillus reuteri]|uniref:Uncharacterized protein n=1 Tax=Limosilactobacillus reuteri TaxID=1598 RepID=A0ABD6Y5J8_LIMRT|nr:hypothetical protein [Limosilactobacillus reuteri]PWT35100.1 hypothetical protein DKZ24_05175 [Limosilactobacillus reuteri]PWT37207.1 hypothetical protein DKZ35_06480 [Limosilactobacillus reuteri]PWT57599.1 hypothetical protein DKZ29_08010 [Limosilactobacillus reuteri]PWT59955.1 hypothetical protein DKZ30_04750 [Limosilactobacillus reuteri]PWT66541.1 hypothetical protein DKZ28_04860 [Limosilactobacillus reuteri]
MQEKLQRAIIQNEIEKNKTILLSSFGLDGIRKSWFKEKIILKILDRFNSDKETALYLFFDELKGVYFADTALERFTYLELEKFIEDERLYMLARML